MSDLGKPAASGVLSRIVGSAEYSIAAGLFVVCLVVAAALWWLQPGEPVAPLPSSVAPTGSAEPVVDERAAVDDWKRKLGQQFGAIEDQQRRRAAEEDARLTRQREDEAAAAEARRREEAIRRDAEARVRQATAMSAPQPAAPALAPTPVPARKPPVIVEAAIDWSSCARPSYPALSASRGEEGVVIIAVGLDANAAIQESRVARSSGHVRLDRVTLEAVSQCRFSPALQDGTPVASTAEVQFTWQLKR